MSTNDQSTLPPAPLIKRLFALGYDCFILLALSMAYSAVATVLMVNMLGLSDSGDYKPMQDGPWFGIGWLFCIISFYWFFWQRAGQTVGMRAWRLKLIATDAPSLSAKHIALRIAFAPISLGALGIGYLWCLFNAKKLAWHDLLSATQVVELPKPVKEKKKKSNKNALPANEHDVKE